MYRSMVDDFWKVSQGSGNGGGVFTVSLLYSLVWLLNIVIISGMSAPPPAVHGETPGLLAGIPAACFREVPRGGGKEERCGLRRELGGLGRVRS